MSIDRFFESQYEQIFMEKLCYDGDCDAGTLRFQTVLGLNPQFSDIQEGRKTGMDVTSSKFKNVKLYNENTRLSTVGTKEERQMSMSMGQKMEENSSMFNQSRMRQEDNRPFEAMDNYRDSAPSESLREVKTIIKTVYEDNEGRQLEETVERTSIPTEMR